MYSGQFLEMYSQSVHAQNLADAKHKRFTSGAMGDIATEPTSFTQLLYRQLARLGLAIPVFGDARMDRSDAR